MSTRHRAFGFSAYKTLRQHRTIPALRLKHRSGSCGTASALPKCSIMSGCGTRHRASGAKAPRTLRPLPLLRFAVSATGGAHLCSIQYYLRFWLVICRTSLAVSALRIMRYCLNLLNPARYASRQTAACHRFRRSSPWRHRFYLPGTPATLHGRWVGWGLRGTCAF